MDNNKLLKMLELDCSTPREQLAAATGLTLEELNDAVAQYEKSGVIVGYQAIVDWELVQPEAVTAMIAVTVTPQSIDGFDRIAERIYQYDEVEGLYLMSGTFDMTVVISGRTLREVAEFVGARLAPIEGVTGTSTHFLLKKYKEKHRLLNRKKNEQERFVFE